MQIWQRLPCILQSPLKRSTSLFTQRNPSSHIVEFENELEAERPFQVDLLNQFLFWGWQVTVSSGKKSVPVKTEAGLWFAPLPLLSAFFLVFKSELQREWAPLEDWKRVLLWARQCSFLFTAAPGPNCSGFVHLFGMTANVTAREATSTPPSSSPLELITMRVGTLAMSHLLFFSGIVICKATIARTASVHNFYSVKRTCLLQKGNTK